MRMLKVKMRCAMCDVVLAKKEAGAARALRKGACIYNGMFGARRWLEEAHCRVRSGARMQGTGPSPLGDGSQDGPRWMPQSLIGQTGRDGRVTQARPGGKGPGGLGGAISGLVGPLWAMGEYRCIGSACNLAPMHRNRRRSRRLPVSLAKSHPVPANRMSRPAQKADAAVQDEANRAAQGRGRSGIRHPIRQFLHYPLPCRFRLQQLTEFGAIVQPRTQMPG